MTNVEAYPVIGLVHTSGVRITVRRQAVGGGLLETETLDPRVYVIYRYLQLKERALASNEFFTIAKSFLLIKFYTMLSSPSLQLASFQPNDQASLKSSPL
jgi:hypothetical protein